jgi:hypothetical protein
MATDKPTRRVKVTEPEVVEVEVLATAIVQISDSVRKLIDGPLTRRAIAVLIRDATTPPVPLSTIDLVLDTAADLKKRYVKSRAP